MNCGVGRKKYYKQDGRLRKIVDDQKERFHLKNVIPYFFEI